MVESQGFVSIIPCERQQHKWCLYNCLIQVPDMKALDASEETEEEEEEDQQQQQQQQNDDSNNGNGNALFESSRPCKLRRTTTATTGGGVPSYNQTSGSTQDQGVCCSQDYIIPQLGDDNLALSCLARASRSDYGSLACASKRFRSLVQSGELYSLRLKLGMAEHWIYMLCNLDRWEAFDPQRQHWMRLPPMPADDCFKYADKESLAVGTELLVFGKEMEGFAVYRYSILNHKWYGGKSMNLPRCLFGSGSHRGQAIVAGGCDAAGNVLKSAELYDSVKDTWERLPDMHSPRKLCSGFFMDGNFYVIGGMKNEKDSLTCGEAFNMKTRTWQMIPNMFPRGNGAAYAPPLVAVVKNQLYAVEYTESSIMKYNKDSVSWSPLGRLPVRTEPTNGWGLAFKACGKNLIVIGGHIGREGESICVNSWQPSREGGPPDWSLMASKQRVGGFVYNCAVMGC